MTNFNPLIHYSGFASPTKVSPAHASGQQVQAVKLPVLCQCGELVSHPCGGVLHSELRH